jgi:hypothetical protein
VDGGVLADRLSAGEQSSKGMRSDETSAVDVSGQHPCRKAAGAGAVRITHGLERARTRVTDLVNVAERELRYARNVVISREKVLSNLRV